MDQLIIAIALWCSNGTSKKSCEERILKCVFNEVRGDHIVNEESSRNVALHNCMKKEVK